MTKEYIRNLLLQIAKQILKEKDLHIEENDDLLYLIISESTRAITFINIIEDEFEIEFDDDDIDAEFFSSFNGIISILSNYTSIT